VARTRTAPAAQPPGDRRLDGTPGLLREIDQQRALVVAVDLVLGGPREDQAQARDLSVLTGLLRYDGPDRIQADLARTGERAQVGVRKIDDELKRLLQLERGV
jgi:hypothetical protein